MVAPAGAPKADERTAAELPAEEASRLASIIATATRTLPVYQQLADNFERLVGALPDEHARRSRSASIARSQGALAAYGRALEALSAGAPLDEAHRYTLREAVKIVEALAFELAELCIAFPEAAGGYGARALAEAMAARSIALCALAPQPSSHEAARSVSAEKQRRSATEARACGEARSCQRSRRRPRAFTSAMAAPSNAEAWGYRYRHGGWGGVGAGFAIGALAGGLIAASTARAYAYPAYGYGGYYPASYGYGYAPVHRVVVVRRRVVAPAYYGGYYRPRVVHYGGYGVRRVGYYGGYYRPRAVHYGGYRVRYYGGGYGVRRVGYYGGGYGIRRGYGVGVGRVGRWR